MPTASVKFIKEGTYAKKTSIYNNRWSYRVFIAANFVSSMPMDILRWVVIIVIAYTSVTMLRKAFAKQTA
ncbi:hypothetical protein Q5M85_06875 [Paraclostridium bifermentans]|nr:hypothetical protein [Paraclostridium bifermentans]